MRGKERDEGWMRGERASIVIYLYSHLTVPVSSLSSIEYLILMLELDLLGVLGVVLI